MNKKIYFPGLVLLLLGASMSLQSCFLMSTLVGNGVAETRSYEFSNFDSLELLAMFDATVAYGESYGVSVTMDSNLFSVLKIEQSGTVLTLGFSKFSQFIPKTNISCTITLPVLNALSLEGAETCHFADVRTSDGATLAGEGVFSLSGNIHTPGSGILNCSGVGSFAFNWYATSLAADISGTANGIIGGAADNASFLLTGFGSLDCSQLALRAAQVEIEGGSDLILNASESISGSIDGWGKISYTGNPSLSVENTGLGELIKLD